MRNLAIGLSLLAVQTVLSPAISVAQSCPATTTVGCPAGYYRTCHLYRWSNRCVCGPCKLMGNPNYGHAEPPKGTPRPKPKKRNGSAILKKAPSGYRYCGPVDVHAPVSSMLRSYSTSPGSDARLYLPHDGLRITRSRNRCYAITRILYRVPMLRKQKIPNC